MGAENIMAKTSYQLLEGSGYVTVKLSGQCDGADIPLVSAEMQALMVKPVHVIVNCENLTYISSEWIRFFLQIQQGLKMNNLGLRFVKPHPTILQLFKKQGIDQAFKCCNDLRTAQVELGLVTARKLDTDFINPFLVATLNVLKIQTKVEAQPGKLYLKKRGDSLLGDISGVIGIVSESFNGSVIISFPAATFLAIMSSMLGETYTEIVPDIIDGAGEITNQVFGQSKAILNEKGYGIKTAIPSVVSGKDHTLTSLTNGPTVVIPFTTKVGEFFVEICISE